MKVLLVEDSATLRYTLCNYIGSAGHEAVVAKSGEEALQLVENIEVDLVIMDVEMPGLNGFETTQLLREAFGDHWVPIIFVTGKCDDDSVVEGIEAGGDDYLPKPISQVILNAKIRAMERIIQMRDQLRALNAELAALSQRDSLTYLYNRRTFDELATHQWAVLNRNRQPVAILMLDIDYFKQYNDHYGHPAGDACLQRVAEAVQSCVRRPEDIIARYGGEEFIALLPNTDHKGALSVAQSIRQAVADLNIPHQKSGAADWVTISIGLASAQFTVNLAINDIIGQADKALYGAKEQGRNRVQSYEVKPHKTVLIVDDDPDCLHLLSEQLRELCNIVTTDCSKDCLDIVHNLHPDLILLDIHMPEVDGLAVCEALKADAATASIPVVLISSEDRDYQVLMGKKVRANDCLEKPIDEGTLLARVNHYLS